MPVSATTQGPGAVPGRRERVRAATAHEIVATARRLLVDGGPAAVTLRAIAREMGMTAPGLYRYVASHEDLMSVLIAALFDELTGELEQSKNAVSPEDIGGRMAETSRAFRRWALAHPAELGLVFGSPLPGYDAPRGGITEQAGRRFAGVFLGLFVELWGRQPFPVRPDRAIDERLREELRAWAPPGTGLPLGAIETFLRCWMRLYGAVVMEAFGQVGFAVRDAEPLFELELASLFELIGVTYRPSP